MSEDLKKLARELESVNKKIGKRAHGGVVGSAHPSTFDELGRPELEIENDLAREKIKEKIQKQGHGGVIGTAHPSALDEISTPELQEDV